MSSLQDKVIAITGAGSGIALELARLTASRGAKLALCDINQEGLDRIVSELRASGTEVVGTRVNVASNEEVDNWTNATVKHFGRLDGAANVAGVEGKSQINANLADTQNDNWDFVLSVNLTGLMYCVRSQIRVMEAGASIVNAASVAGMFGRAGICAYSVSKHGVVGLTKTVAKEVGSKGIRVNAVAPGPIETPMLARVLDNMKDITEKKFTDAYASLPIQRKGQAIEIANMFAFLLSDESSYMTGVIVPVDGGLAA
ncbi:oxidoreductase [Exophiala viscosa]|uniref:Oxidoreductase n=1 Tax=Exophiala viscosa TaxID=2486360 RepID=A0AAN6DN88_9EURO|nr:oxidoreductase [Exophiala viscosa]